MQQLDYISCNAKCIDVAVVDIVKFTYLHLLSHTLRLKSLTANASVWNKNYPNYRHCARGTELGKIFISPLALTVPIFNNFHKMKLLVKTFKNFEFQSFVTQLHFLAIIENWALV